MSLTGSKLYNVMQTLYFNLGLLNVLYLVVCGLTLLIALNLRQHSRFQVHRLLYGFAGYFGVLAVFSDLYRVKSLRSALLFRFRTFAVYQYSVIAVSLCLIIAVLLWFCFNFFLNRISYDYPATPDAPGPGAPDRQSDRPV